MYAEQLLPYPMTHELFQRLNHLFGNENDGAMNLLRSQDPSFNFWEDEEAFYVEIEIPGVKTEDVDLSLIGTELSVKFNRPTPKEEENVKFIRQERKFGQTIRTIALPMEAPPQEIEATQDQGILCIRLKKPEAAKVQKIAIQPKPKMKLEAEEKKPEEKAK